MGRFKIVLPLQICICKRQLQKIFFYQKNNYLYIKMSVLQH